MHTENPKVAVIIPIYNMGKYLPDCLDSLSKQTLKELEIICVNDGSTDNTAEILSRHAARDSRITIISHPNCGVGPSRNAGIRAATAEYIAFLDPDDTFPLAESLELMYNKAKLHGVNICGGSLATFTDSSSALNQRFIKSQQGFLFHKEEEILYTDYQYDYGFYRFIYKRDMLLTNEIFFPPYPRFQDPPFMVRAFTTAKRFYALPRVTYAYRVEHKPLNWNEAKVAGLFNGLRDVWDIATSNNLTKLQQYVWQRIREHYHLVEPLVTQEQTDFINEVQRATAPPPLTPLQRLFSIEKNFLHRKQRRLNILGLKFVYRK